MPEATDLTARRGEVTSGFWIRRLSSPVARPRRLVRAEDNKENVPPVGFVGPTPWRRRWMRQRMRKSPLPDWHPRTPLRDITAIVNALERRRLRVQAGRATQVNRDREASPSNPLVSPLPQQLSLADQTTTCIASSSPVEHPLQTPSTSSSSKVDHSPSNIQQTETEEKLSRSIDQIEKIVKNNLNRTVKEVSAKRVRQRRTLMSMR